MNQRYSGDVIVALDFKNLEESLAFLAPFSGHDQLYVKVGMELYLQNGPQVLSALKERGHRIFLDLKLHDIPNTVYGASKGLAQFKVDMLNFHAAGGKEMLEAAKQGLIDGGSPETLAIANPVNLYLSRTNAGRTIDSSRPSDQCPSLRAVDQGSGFGWSRCLGS